MTVVIWIAVIGVIAAVVFVARGRGGELSAERSDYVPLDMGPVSATDVALLRPPTGLWGYNMQATDEALEQIAESIRERDVRIVALEQLVTDLSREHPPKMPLGSPYAGARHRRTPAGTAADPLRRAAFEAGAAGPLRTAPVEAGEADPLWQAAVERGGSDPLGTMPAEPGGAGPLRAAPAEAAGAGPVRRVTFEPGGTDPLGAARAEAGADPLRTTPAEGSGIEPLRAAPVEAGEAGAARTTTHDTVATESVRLPAEPAEPGRPGGNASGPPPEQSHD